MDTQDKVARIIAEILIGILADHPDLQAEMGELEGAHDALFIIAEKAAPARQRELIDAMFATRGEPELIGLPDRFTGKLLNVLGYIAQHGEDKLATVAPRALPVSVAEALVRAIKAPA